MKYKLIIWDFNGTVMDDTLLSVESINTVLRRRSLPPLEGKEALQRVFCFPVREYYEKLGFDFDAEPFEVPADEWVELYDKGKFSSPLCPGVKDVLETVKKLGARQIIISASQKDLLNRQLEKLGVAKYFDDVLGIEDHYAKGKISLCREWLDRQDKNSVFPALFIGDTDHDYYCAAEIGCDCILYSNGFMSRERLLTLGAPVVDEMQNIIDFINS